MIEAIEAGRDVALVSQISVRSKFNLFYHVRCHFIRLIHEFPITGSIARQPLLMADQACDCWFFFISIKFNGLIFNMECAI